MPDVQLSWSSQNPAVAQISSSGVVTAAGNGNASVSVTAGSATSSVSVIVLQLPTVFEVLGGNDQEGAAGEVLPLPLRIRIEDRLGQPVQGRGISFIILAGGGTVTPSPSTTLAGGIAVADWRLGEVAGTPQVVLASVVGAAQLSTELHAVARAGLPAGILKDSGDGQSVVRSGALPVDLTVHVRDRLGNSVSGVLVTFQVTTGGGSVTPASRMTGADGRASTAWTLGPQLGAQTVSAVTSGLTPVQFTATALAVPGELRAEAPTQQTTTVGQAVPIPPAVRLLDQAGLPIAFAPVTFSVQSGNGSVAPSGVATAGAQLVVNTDASGIARVGAWILGTTAGQNTLLASAPGNVSVLFSATGVAGPAAALQKLSGDGQTAGPGMILALPIVVRVTDAFGNVVPGVTVQFTPDAGSGVASPLSAVGAANGLAETRWTLGGTAGEKRLTATIPGGGAVVFTATATVGGGGGLHIDFNFVGGASDAVQSAFAAAATRWAQIIVEKLPDQTLTVPANSACTNPDPVTATFDDLYVFVLVQNIDGPGLTLAQAGPCFVRIDSQLPVVGRVRLDASDVNNLISQGRLGDVVLHELGHVLGFGTRWNAFGLLQNSSLQTPGADTHFSGTRAIAAFNAVGGTGYTLGQKVPVENTLGGSGTRDSHWRSSVFGQEVMIGFINRSGLPLSRVTAASLADLGYTVNEGAANAYSLPGAGAQEGVAEELIPLGNDVLLGPVFTVDRAGRTFRSIEPAGPPPSP
ncbi:MAG: hypothetical protein EXR92_05450 [Gemmatimonadetes bacterium]|nr:hypothetical protein [Gemmatimonadota bacterium]